MAKEASAMKQRRKTVIGAGALLLLLAAGACYLMADENANVEEESVWLCDRGVEDVTSLTIKSSEDGREFIFVREEEVFEGNDGSTYDIDQLAPYIAVLGYMKADKKVHTSDFQASGYTVTLTYENESFSYRLGNRIDGVGMYVSLAGREDIYLVDSLRAEEIEEMILSLYHVEFKDMKLDEIRGIRLYTPENGLILMNRSEAPRANEDFYWNMFEPFVWTADTEVVDEILNTIKEIRYLKRTDRKMEPYECGLEKEDGQIPYLTFYDVDDNELTIYLGDEAGDDVYCRTIDLKDVYLIDRSVLQSLNVTAEEAADPVLYHYEIPSVKACTVEWHGEQYELSAKWSQEEEDQRGQRFYLNGERITGAEYRSLTDWFSKTGITGVSKDARQQTAIEGTITIERLSAPYRQEFLFRTVQEDASLLQVNLKGSAAVYIKREKVEEFISSLKQ